MWPLDELQPAAAPERLEGGILTISGPGSEGAGQTGGRNSWPGHLEEDKTRGSDEGETKINMDGYGGCQEPLK